MQPNGAFISWGAALLLLATPAVLKAQQQGEPASVPGVTTVSSATLYTGDFDGDEEDAPVIRVGRAVDLAGRDIQPQDSAAFPGFVLGTGMPLRSVRLTSGFGQRHHPILGGTRFHSGIDMSAASGTPVYATAAGRVQSAGYVGGYGIMVAIAHPGSTQTRYAHLSALAVREGESVSQGEVIGYVGSTGRSTGPHLHYEMRVGGRPVDPSRYWYPGRISRR